MNLTLLNKITEMENGELPNKMWIQTQLPAIEVMQLAK